MNAAKTPKDLEKMPYPSQKSKLLKRKGNSITPVKTNAPISQLTIQIYQMRNKKFKNKAWTTLRGISKTYLPVTQKQIYVNYFRN